MDLLPTQNNKYTWFYYLGILFFISNLILFGFGIQISYFGIILILLGLFKPILSGWFTTFLFVLIFIEIYMDIHFFKQKFTKKVENKKGGIENKDKKENKDKDKNKDKKEKFSQKK